MGALKLGKTAETERLFKDLEVLPVYQESARSSAKIMLESSQAGRAIGYRDAIVVGIARSKGISKIISNDEAFARVGGLSLQTF